MLRKEQRCCAEEHYSRRFPKAVQVAHYSPRQPHVRLSLHSRGEEPDSAIAMGNGWSIVNIQFPEPDPPISVPSSSSIALQMWKGFWGVMLGMIGRALSPVHRCLPRSPSGHSCRHRPGFFLPCPSGWLTTLTSLQSFALSPPRMGACLCIGPAPQNSKQNCKPS